MTLIQYVKSVPGVVEHHLCNYLFILESTVCFIVPNGLIITLIGDCKMTKHRRQSTLKWHRCMVRCDYLHTARPLSRHNVEMGILIVQYTIIHAKAVRRSYKVQCTSALCTCLLLIKGSKPWQLGTFYKICLGQMNTDLGLSC